MKRPMIHTPGPWIADFPQVKTGDGLVICDVRHAGTFNKNECLIAAAPDLLAALKTLLEDDCPYVSDTEECECGEGGKQDCCHTQAKRAIAKAEGKSPW